MGLVDVDLTRPVVHDVWNVVVASLTFEEVYDVNRSLLRTITSCVEAVDEFMSGRLQNDVWPILENHVLATNPKDSLEFLKENAKYFSGVPEAYFSTKKFFFSQDARLKTRVAALWRELYAHSPSVAYAHVCEVDEVQRRLLELRGWPRSSLSPVKIL